MPYFVYSSVDRHLGVSHGLAIMNNTTVTIHVQVFGQTYLGCRPKSRVAGSSGNSMLNTLSNARLFAQ